MIILDGILGVVTALQVGNLPRRHEREKTDDRRRRSATPWMIIAGITVVVGTLALVVAFLKAPGGLTPLGIGSAPPAAVEPPPPGTTRPSPSPASGAGGFGSSLPTPSASQKSPTPSGAPTTSSGKPLPLTAEYQMAEGGQALLGYQASVTIANAATVAKQDWRLVITLPRATLTVAEVSGATVQRDDETWTFAPTVSTTKVPPHGSVTVSFEVRGATLISGKPTACTIDGRPCDGLSD